MEYLRDANFDPEFYKNYESEIVAAYNSEFGTHIEPQKKSWKRILKRVWLYVDYKLLPEPF